MYVFVCYRIVFFLLYNNFIPLSLYVTIEIVNLGQALFISSDVQMYHPGLDVACTVRASNLGTVMVMSDHDEYEYDDEYESDEFDIGVSSMMSMSMIMSMMMVIRGYLE